jgi:predicted Fe-Mo cluster-binding NifX family protein
MKIAISAQHEGLDSPFEPRFGRVPGFVLFDTETKATAFLDNAKHQDLAQGAGIKTAQALAKQGVDVLLTGNIGPKAMQALSKSGIEIRQTKGSSVGEVLSSYQSGRTEANPAGAKAPNPEGAGQGKGLGGGTGRGGGKGRGPLQGGRGMGGGARGQGPGKGGRGMGGGGGRKGGQGNGRP